MVISKKDKQKFKKAMNAKSNTQETTKRGRGRPSKVEKLDKKVDYSLPKEKRVIWDGIIDTQEEITKEIVIPDLKETLVEEKVQEEIKQDEGTEISEQVPNFLDEEEVQEAISERKDELSSQREELEEVKEDFEDIELDESDELDLSDLEDETVKEKEDEIIVEEEKEVSDDIEDLDLSDFEGEIIEEKTSVEITPEPIETQDTQETKEEQEEVVAKEEVKEEDKVEENKEKEEKTKSGFMEMWNKNKNYVIIGAVALALAWAGIFAFKDKIFWNEQPVKPVVQEQTPVEQNTEEKEKEKQPEIKETSTADLFTKAELTEENKLILNKLVPMSLSLEKGLQEIYDAKKTNETNHWTIKNYDKKYKKTSIVDIQTQINQNLQDIKWVDDAEDDLVKGKSDTDSEGNELSPEEKLKRENNPALSVKKYNWDEGDIKGEIKTSLTIKQGKEKKYGFKINADVEGKKDTTYMFFKNFGINTKDQDLIDKSELDKFSLQNKMLTVSDEKENRDMLGLLGEYRTQLLGFNFLANILNNSEVEGSDEPVQFVDTKEVDEDTEEETTPVVEKKTKKKELVTTSTNGVKEEKPEVEEKEVKEESKETSEAKEKVDTTIENKEETDTKETDETKEVKDEEKDSLKASYKIKVSWNTIKEELQNLLRVKESLTKVFLENWTNSPLKEFVEAIKEEDTLNINYDTKENKALVSWELAGYDVKGIIGDKEEIVLTKDGKETKITLTLTDILVKAKITSEKEETVFENGLLAKDGIYKTHFLFSKDLIKKNGKKTNVYKLSNKGVLAKDNEQLPVYAKEYTKENLKGKYEVNFNFITTEYNKLIEKAFGVKEDNKEKGTTVETKEKENKEVVKNEEKTEENKKETEKKEVKAEEKNSKEEKAKNPVKEVFKEVEKEDAKVWAGAVAEQPK